MAGPLSGEEGAQCFATAKLRHRPETHHAIVGEAGDERIDVPGHEQRLDMFDKRFGLLGGSRVVIAFLAQWLNRHHVLPACGVLCGTVHAMQGETGL
jgi:hypothetical protein